MRAFDAAANRTSEGLRVIEDFVRFVLDDAHLTQLAKELRHDLTAACADVPWPERFAARETQSDVGTEISTGAENRRADAWAVCRASLERTKQSLRSLEEFGKVVSEELAPQFEALRYRLYTLEQAVAGTQHSLERLAGVRLCVLVDGGDSANEFETLVGQLLSAGVEMIQLRDKRLADAELVERARLLRQMTHNSPALVIINDRPDIAAAVDADGVHLGQEDMGVKDARKIVGPAKLIGVSTHTIKQARSAVVDGANYLGAGPTFPSSTKSFDAFPGLEFLLQVASEIRMPTLAIGGINAANLTEVLETGCCRIAVSSAIAAAEHPGSEAKNLREMIESSAKPQASVPAGS